MTSCINYYSCQKVVIVLKKKLISYNLEKKCFILSNFLNLKLCYILF